MFMAVQRFNAMQLIIGVDVNLSDIMPLLKAADARTGGRGNAVDPSIVAVLFV